MRILSLFLFLLFSTAVWASEHDGDQDSQSLESDSVETKDQTEQTQTRETSSVNEITGSFPLD